MPAKTSQERRIPGSSARGGRTTLGRWRHVRGRACGSGPDLRKPRAVVLPVQGSWYFRSKSVRIDRVQRRRRLRRSAAPRPGGLPLHPVEARVGDGDQLGRGPAVGRERRDADRDADRDVEPAVVAERRRPRTPRRAARPCEPPPRRRRRAGGSRTRRRRSGPGCRTPGASAGSRSAVQRRTSSPRRWPNVSLTSLKSSRSSISRLSGRWIAPRPGRPPGRTARGASGG